MTKKSRDRRKANRVRNKRLNSLIEKASPKWKDVDVDKFITEVR